MFESEMKPRFRALAVGKKDMPLLRVSVGLWILLSCDWWPSKRNSVLAPLRQRRLEAIHHLFSSDLYSLACAFLPRSWSSPHPISSWLQY